MTLSQFNELLKASQSGEARELTTSDWEMLVEEVGADVVSNLIHEATIQSGDALLSARYAAFAFSPKAWRLMKSAGIDVSAATLASILMKSPVEGRRALNRIASSNPEGRDWFRDRLRRQPGNVAVDRQKLDRIVRIHSRRFAICLEGTTSVNGSPVLQLEGAEFSQERSAVDWADKLVIQLDTAEVLEVVRVVSGQTAAFEGEGHGVSHDKRFSFRAQEEGIYVNLRQARRSIGVPVSGAKVTLILKLALDVIRETYPSWSIDEILQVQRVANSGAARAC